ncbi:MULTISPECIES: DNA mismatch repair protein MutT [Micrococcus]|uniref:NUDIX hydrolase n=1 Tax=Micrococcus TaxID=1269 RepID=UPI001D1300D8|nr:MULTISPECIES: DNA mismatch repair protein MutT [Micrococcus]WIK83252.1 DNA mismatch repair protein MutT [Micrococcus lylae]
MTADRAAEAALIRAAVSTAVLSLRTDRSGRTALHVALVPRTRAPFLDRWAVPGRWLEADADVDETAEAVAAETVGVSPAHLEQLAVFGAVDRSPTGRVLTLAHWALTSGTDREGWNVRWFDVDRVPALAFDHAQIVAAARTALARRLDDPAVAGALMPAEFTLGELRAAHEAVTGERLDAANFRRTALGDPSVQDTGTVRTGTPYRPPRLYRFAAPEVTRALRPPPTSTTPTAAPDAAPRPDERTDR